VLSAPAGGPDPDTVAGVDRIRVALRSGNRSFALDIATTMQSQLDRLEREVSRLADIVDRLAARDDQ
jgi:hypothetical protein